MAALIISVSDGELYDVVESLFHGQFGLLTTWRLAGDLDQLLDDDGNQHASCQRVEDADRPHSDVGVEHVCQDAPVEERTAVTPPQTDHGHVLEGRDQSEGDQEERDEEALSVGGDAAVEEQTVVIPPVNTATTRSTVSTVD